MKLSKEQYLIHKLFDELREIFFLNLNKDFNVFKKGEQDLVTSMDYALEQYIIDYILKHFPDDNIISEETKNQSCLYERNWVIDPLDGTCNYANGINIYGVQIALLFKEKPVLAYIYHPSNQELFYAQKGKGAYLNDVPITVNSSVEITNSIITFGDFSKSNMSSRDVQVNIMSCLKDKVLKFRMWGSSCYDLAYLAAGRTHGHLMFSKNVWDVLPGLLIAEEAGAFISSIDGEEFNIQKGSLVIASNQTILDLITNGGWYKEC